jgi:hypothetical protein
MSNNKQSSVEWLAKELLEKYHLKIDEYKEFKQAKAMHKEEIEEAYDDAIMKGRQEDGNEYYTETYKSNET